jgi:hypothetical protein
MKNIRDRIYLILSIAIGLFFLFSLFSKIVSLGDWLDFNYELVDNWLGYINGFVILVIELYFGISFVFLKANKKISLTCFIFVLMLTFIVLLNKELFQSCMCFGSLIKIRPDGYFILKNTVLMISTLIIYMLHKNKISLT